MATEFLKVRENKISKQKIITIPKEVPIYPGDYVKVIKVNGE